MKKWTRKMKRIMAFVLMLVLMGTSMDMTAFAGGTVSGGDAGLSVSTGNAQDTVSGGNAGSTGESTVSGGNAGGTGESTVSGGDGGFTEVSTEDELRTAIENGENVKLMAGITLTDTVYISDSLTVDLNGQSVTGVEEKSVFTVTGSGTEVTFTDSGADGTGKVTAVGDVYYTAAILVKSEASVTIEKGTYAGGYAPLIVKENGSASVNGGTFDGEDAFCVALNDGGNLTISAGTFQKDGSYLIYSYSGTTKLTGGSFLTTTEVRCCVVDYRGGILDLSGVTEEGYEFYFGNTPGENQVIIPEGYVWLNGNIIDNEINVDDWLTLAKPTEVTLVTFDANGGSGTMAPVSMVNGDYSLPECEFTAPEGLGFLGWATTADGTAMKGSYRVTEDITFYAIWGKVYDLYLGNVGMMDGDYLACGATEVTKTQPAAGGYAYYKDGILTLNNYEYEGEGYWYYVRQDWSCSCVLYGKEELELKLIGKNKLINTATESDGIIIEGDLTVSGTGSLELDADYYGIYCDSYYDEAANDYVGGNLMIQSGTLSIAAEDAINLSGNLTMNNGTLIVDSYYEAIDVDGDVTINGGTMDVTSSAYEGFYVDGEIIVNNGSLYIDSGTVAMDAWDGITIAEDVVELLYPGNGSIYYDESMSTYCIVDANGTPVKKAIIGPAVEHTWSTDYVYNHEAHWHVCTDTGCFLEKDSSMYAGVAGSAYGEHDTNGAGGVCSVCGYNTKKIVGVYVGNVGLADGEYLDNSGRISAAQPTAGGYAYYKGGVLTLKEFVYEGEGHEYEEDGYTFSAAVYCELEELKLVLQGESLINTYNYGDGIYSVGDLSIEGDSLIVNAVGDGIDLDGNLTINSGNITITTQDDDGIDVDSDATITMNGGVLTIKADDKGIDSAGDIIVNGGTLNISSDTDDSLNMEGDIIIRDGVINLNADDDGLSAKNILIEGGTITVEAGDYGILAHIDLTIQGGVLTLTSDLDTKKENAPAIKVNGDLTLAEQVELQKPEKGMIDTLEEETGTEGVFEYFQTIVDADGKIATYVVIKEKQSAAPTPTPTPGGTTTPTPGNSGAANGTYTSPKTGEPPVMPWLISCMMVTTMAGGFIWRKRKMNK